MRNPSISRQRRLAIFSLLLTSGLLALRCGGGGFEEKPPKMRQLIAYNSDGAMSLEWDDGKQALVEKGPAKSPPSLDYSSANQWLLDGVAVAGPGVSLNDTEIASHMRPKALGLGPAKKILGMSCQGPGNGLICFAAVCTLEGDTLKSYVLRACEDKDHTTAGCKTYKVESGSITHCPAYFHGS